MPDRLNISAIQIILVVRIVKSNEIVKGSEGGRELGLGFHVVFRRDGEQTETPLEYSKDTLDNVTSLSMSQIKELFCISWPVIRERLKHCTAINFRPRTFALLRPIP